MLSTWKFPLGKANFSNLKLIAKLKQLEDSLGHKTLRFLIFAIVAGILAIFLRDTITGAIAIAAGILAYTSSKWNRSPSLEVNFSLSALFQRVYFIRPLKWSYETEEGEIVDIWGVALRNPCRNLTSDSPDFYIATFLKKDWTDWLESLVLVILILLTTVIPWSMKYAVAVRADDGTVLGFIDVPVQAMPIHLVFAIFGVSFILECLNKHDKDAKIWEIWGYRAVILSVPLEGVFSFFIQGGVYYADSSCIRMTNYSCYVVLVSAAIMLFYHFLLLPVYEVILTHRTGSRLFLPISGSEESIEAEYPEDAEEMEDENNP